MLPTSSFVFPVDIVLDEFEHHATKIRHFDCNRLVLLGHLWLFIVGLIALAVRRFSRVLACGLLRGFRSAMALFAVTRLISAAVTCFFSLFFLLIGIFHFTSTMNSHIFVGIETNHL
jgi:hypothetical protein